MYLREGYGSRSGRPIPQPTDALAEPGKITDRPRMVASQLFLVSLPGPVAAVQMASVPVPSRPLTHRNGVAKRQHSKLWLICPGSTVEKTG